MVAVGNRFSASGGKNPRMMQETEVGPASPAPWGYLSGQGLVALLSLVGTKKAEVEVLRDRTKLKPAAFRSLLNWLQREYLVDVVSCLAGDEVQERVELTERGEKILMGILERTCELPELR